MHYIFKTLLYIMSICIFAQPAISLPENYKYYQQFRSIFDFVEQEYVEAPDKQKMLDSAIQGMLSTLDPHSLYLVDENFEYLWDNTKGEFGGIGIEMIFDNNLIHVISPIDDLPAERAGIKAGDYIVTVEGESVQTLGYHKSINKLRGKPGTNIKIGVYTKGDEDIREVNITREIVKIKPVKTALDNDIAYIRIVSFNEATIKDLRKAFNQLDRKAKKNKTTISGIVLDLRNNPGGIIEEAVGVAEFFIDEGIIVSTKGRTGRSHVTYSASRNVEKAPKVPLIVLINGGSASGSEIVAGAIRDYKRGMLLGTKTFGKGSAQYFTKLSNRSGIKLTYSKYYTPNGTSIQGEGITPDLVIKQIDITKQNKEANELGFLSEKLLKNHLTNNENDKKSAPNTNDTEVTQEFVASERYNSDYQYSRAIDLLRGVNIMNSFIITLPH